MMKEKFIFCFLFISLHIFSQPPSSDYKLVFEDNFSESLGSWWWPQHNSTHTIGSCTEDQVY